MGVASTDDLWWPLSVKRSKFPAVGRRAQFSNILSGYCVDKSPDRPFSFCRDWPTLQCDAPEETFNAGKGCLYADAAAAPAGVKRQPQGVFSSRLAAGGDAKYVG